MQDDSFSKAVRSVLLSNCDEVKSSPLGSGQAAGKKIAFFGTFDVHNYGDHLFPAIFRRVARQFSAGIEVRLFSPDRAIDPFDGDAVHALDDLNQMHSELEAFVIGGGDIIRFDPRPIADQHDPPFTAYLKMLLLPTLHASFAGKPVAWSMPGIPYPFSAEQQTVMKQILKSTGYISVRDPDSKGYLGFWDGDIDVVPDSAFLLSKYFPKEKLLPIQAELRQDLGLRDRYMVFHASPATTDPDQFELAARHLRQVAETLGLPVLLLPLGLVHGDREFLAEIERSQPGCFRLLTPDFHPLEIASLIAHSTFYVGTGLHGNITAVAYGVPCAVVNLLNLSKLNHFGNLAGQPVLRTWQHLGESALTLKMQSPCAETRLLDLQDRILAHFHKLLSFITEAKPQPHTEAASEFRLIEAILENDRHARPNVELENRRLAAECRKMREKARSKNIRLSHLLKENIQFSQVNEQLSQAMREVSFLNAKLRGSWIWLPLKPFRWLERAIRRQRKKFQARYLRRKPPAEETATPSLPPSAVLSPWDDSAIDYKRWLALCEKFEFEAPEETAKDMASLPYQPLISILIPVYNTPEPLLRRAIDSVFRQDYERWELCLADDASTQPHVKKMLLELEKSDSRIKVVFREQNGHISATSNSALALARGEFSALVDHDDELTPDALSSIVRELAEYPDANLIYSDYDRIDSDGDPCAAYFKPDWNPDLLLSQNYICHLAVYRTDLLRKIGGFREGLEGSQDWDLCLRVSEACRAEQIRHIPKILYHWRKHEQSASHNLSSNHYAVIAAKRAVAEHLERIKRKASVMDTQFEGWFRVRYEIEHPPKVSIIICTRDRIDLLCPCVKSILERTDYQDYEILIVDNGSREKSSEVFFDECRKSSRVRVIKDDGEFNYSALNNRAVSQARGDVLCFLNNDTVVISDEWLAEMVSHAVREEIGAVGAKLLFPDGRIQHAGIVLGIGGFAGHVFAGLSRENGGYMGRAQLIQNYTAITGACMVMRKSVFREVGGFNEQELKVSFNDIDLCLRIHCAGYRNLWTPYALLYHYESASRGLDITPGQQEQAALEAGHFHDRWGEFIYDDPAYNPNLSLLKTDFSLSFPPRNPAPVSLSVPPK